MYELVPGSGVFIHQDNYQIVMSKERDGQPDGKAMARYLMSCFWKQVSFSLYLSVCLYLCLSLSVCLCLSLSVSVCLSRDLG